MIRSGGHLDKRASPVQYHGSQGEGVLNVERVTVKAVLLGVLADIGASVAAAMILLPLFAGGSVSSEMSADDMEVAVKQIMQNGWFLIANFVVGLSCSALGGYVAARVAKKEIYLNAALVGLFSLLIGSLNLSGEYPIWFNVGGLFLVIPAALVGAQLAGGRAAS